MLVDAYDDGIRKFDSTALFEALETRGLLNEMIVIITRITA